MATVVGAFEAKTHLAALLDKVQSGEDVVITRHGRPVARLVPAVTEDVQDIVAQLWALRAETTLDCDWRELRDFGRR